MQAVKRLVENSAKTLTQFIVSNADMVVNQAEDYTASVTQATMTNRQKFEYIKQFPIVTFEKQSAEPYYGILSTFGNIDTFDYCKTLCFSDELMERAPNTEIAVKVVNQKLRELNNEGIHFFGANPFILVCQMDYLETLFANSYEEFVLDFSLKSNNFDSSGQCGNLLVEHFLDNVCLCIQQMTEIKLEVLNNLQR